MKGEVIKMGTMQVDGETLTGVFVMVDPDELTKENLLYDKVNIKKEDE